MYPHKNYLLFIFIFLNFYIIEAKNTENNDTYSFKSNTHFVFKTEETSVKTNSREINLNAPNNTIIQSKTQEVYCGAEVYNSAKTYKKTGVLVFYNCKIWRNVGYANPGVKPEGNNSWAWEFVSFCNESNCAQNVYCNTYEYDNEIKYKANTKVFYNCKIWNKKSDNGDAGVKPGGNNSWAWEFVSFCDEGGCSPNIYCDAYEYDSEIKYKANSKVYNNCMIWNKKSDNGDAGVEPSGNNSWAWEFVDYCEESNNCTFYNGVLEYNETMTYQPGMKVYYDGKIWLNNKTYNINGQTPNTSNSNPWTLEKTLSVEDDILKENIQLYYNNYKIYYDFSKLENISQIICYDIKGSIIFSKKVSNSKNIINLPSIQQGLYFLQIFNNNAKTFKKIIVL